MSQLNLVQKIASIIGKKVKGGGNTWFSSDISDPDNQTVYTSIEPELMVKSLGAIEASDLPAVAKARVQSLLRKI